MRIAQLDKCWGVKKEELELISDFMCNHRYVKQSDLREPITDEYDRYFKRYIEEGRFHISESEKYGSAKLMRKTDEQVKEKGRWRGKSNRKLTT